MESPVDSVNPALTKTDDSSIPINNEETIDVHSDSSEDVYVVEKIVGKQMIKGKLMYKVRWNGYGPAWDTLEPPENLLSCQDLIEEWSKEAEMKKQRRTRKNVTQRWTYIVTDSADKDSGARSLLKDRFWDDLEHGKIELPKGDMYSKIKTGRAAKPTSLKESDMGTHEHSVASTSKGGGSGKRGRKKKIQLDKDGKNRGSRPKSRMKKKSLDLNEGEFSSSCAPSSSPTSTARSSADSFYSFDTTISSTKRSASSTSSTRSSAESTSSISSTISCTSSTASVISPATTFASFSKDASSSATYSVFSTKGPTNSSTTTTTTGESFHSETARGAQANRSAWDMLAASQPAPSLSRESGTTLSTNLDSSSRAAFDITKITKSGTEVTSMSVNLKKLPANIGKIVDVSDGGVGNALSSTQKTNEMSRSLSHSSTDRPPETENKVDPLESSSKVFVSVLPTTAPISTLMTETIRHITSAIDVSEADELLSASNAAPDKTVPNSAAKVVSEVNIPIAAAKDISEATVPIAAINDVPVEITAANSIYLDMVPMSASNVASKANVLMTVTKVRSKDTLPTTVASSVAKHSAHTAAENNARDNTLANTTVRKFPQYSQQETMEALCVRKTTAKTTSGSKKGRHMFSEPTVSSANVKGEPLRAIGEHSTTEAFADETMKCSSGVKDKTKLMMKSKWKQSKEDHRQAPSVSKAVEFKNGAKSLSTTRTTESKVEHQALPYSNKSIDTSIGKSKNCTTKVLSQIKKRLRDEVKLKGRRRRVRIHETPDKIRDRIPNNVKVAMSDRIVLRKTAIVKIEKLGPNFSICHDVRPLQRCSKSVEDKLFPKETRSHSPKVSVEVAEMIGAEITVIETMKVEESESARNNEDFSELVNSELSTIGTSIAPQKEIGGSTIDCVGEKIKRNENIGVKPQREDCKPTALTLAATFQESCSNDEESKNPSDGNNLSEENNSSDGNDRSERKNSSDGINRSEAKNSSDGINRLEGKNSSDGINRLEGVNSSGGINRSERKNSSDGINRSEGKNSSAGINRSERKNSSDGINRLEGKNSSGGINRSERKNSSDGIYRLERKNSSDGINRSEGKNSSEGINRSESSGGKNSSDGINRSERKNSSDGIYRSEGKNSSDGTNRLEGKNSSGGINRSERKNSSDGINRLEGKNSSGGINRSERKNSSDGIFLSEGKNSSDGINRSEGKNLSGGTFRSERKNYSDGNKRSEGKNSSDGIDRSEGMNSSDGINRSEGKNSSDGINRLEGMNSSEGINHSERKNSSDGINRSERKNSSDGINRSKRSNSLDGTNRSEGNISLYGTKRSDGGNLSEENNRSEGNNRSDGHKAVKRHLTSDYEGKSKKKSKTKIAETEVEILPDLEDEKVSDKSKCLHKLEIKNTQTSKNEQILDKVGGVSELRGSTETPPKHKIESISSKLGLESAIQNLAKRSASARPSRIIQIDLPSTAKYKRCNSDTSTAKNTDSSKSLPLEKAQRPNERKPPALAVEVPKSTDTRIQDVSPARPCPAAPQLQIDVATLDESELFALLDEEVEHLTEEDLEKLDREEQAAREVVLTPVELKTAVKMKQYEKLKVAFRNAEPGVYNLESCDHTGMTLLMMAAYEGSADICELLIGHGARLDAAQKTGATSLIHAADQGHADAVIKLLELGASINHQNAVGESPLMRAVKKGHKGAVEALLSFGANLAQTNHGEMTALRLSQLMKNSDIRLLLEHHQASLKIAFEQEIEAQIGKAMIISEPLFPMQCYSLSESGTQKPQFKLTFQHELKPIVNGFGTVLCIAHAITPPSGVQCRLFGACAIRQVTLNGVTQVPLTEEGMFVLTFTPLHDCRNEVHISTVEVPRSRANLIVGAYRARLRTEI